MEKPGYVRLHETGELARRIEALESVLRECVLCPRKCRVNRLQGERGVCRAGSLPFVSSSGPHFGEERPLVGRRGSGTIFLTWCNLECVFCQNCDISRLGSGEEVTVEELGRMMVSLSLRGCHNINFVTPTHQIPQIVAALPYAVRHGLSVPLVYNCGGYESVETLKFLDGVFDIYMPDFKYGDDEAAQKYSGAPGYVEAAKAALREMHRQTGNLTLDETGVAVRGLLVRHLVLPDGLAATGEVMKFISREISPDTYVNIMGQYRPACRASGHPPLNRPITSSEYREAVAAALEEGLKRLDGVTV